MILTQPDHAWATRNLPNLEYERAVIMWSYLNTQNSQTTKENLVQSQEKLKDNPKQIQCALTCRPNPELNQCKPVPKDPDLNWYKPEITHPHDLKMASKLNQATIGTQDDRTEDGTDSNLPKRLNDQDPNWNNVKWPEHTLTEPCCFKTSINNYL